LENITKNEDYFLGSITYLFTTKGTDVEICEKMMDAIITGARSVASNADSNKYLVANVSEDEGWIELLDDIALLSVANYIVYNTEYYNIISDHAHYLMGRNDTLTNYITSTTKKTYRDTGEMSALSSPMEAAKIALLFSAILN